MKRFRLWLLPVLLGVLAWGLKWRADHPTPTELDLELRALLSQPLLIEVIHSFENNKERNHYQEEMLKEEMKEFSDSLHVLRAGNAEVESIQDMLKMDGYGVMSVYYGIPKRKDGLEIVFVTISTKSNEGKIVMCYPDKRMKHDLHPTTTKRWRELLLNHPRVGPELRRRMKP